MVANWKRFLRISGGARGESKYAAVNNLLRLLRWSKCGSVGSEKVYCYALFSFCQYTKKNPDELVKLDVKEIEKSAEDFGYAKRKDGCSPRTVNVYLADLKTFFGENGFKNERELHFIRFYSPARARVRREYVPTIQEAIRMAECSTSLRDKTIILLLAFSGLRNSTLRALRYGDVREELETGEKTILIRVYPEMKEVVNAACKGKIPYFTFIGGKAVEYLKLYIAQIFESKGEFSDESPLFPTRFNQIPFEKRWKKPIGDRTLQQLVKMAAKNAGLKEWKYVYPHCLRKTFDSWLRTKMKDGTELHSEDRVFLMGHVALPGDLEPYYYARIEELREKYSQLISSPDEEKMIKALEKLEAALLHCQKESNTAEENDAHGIAEGIKAIRESIEEIQQGPDNNQKNRMKQMQSSTNTGEPPDEQPKSTGSRCNKKSCLQTRTFGNKKGKTVIWKPNKKAAKSDGQVELSRFFN